MSEQQLQLQASADAVQVQGVHFVSFRLVYRVSSAQYAWKLSALLKPCKCTGRLLTVERAPIVMEKQTRSQLEGKSSY